MPDTPTRLVLSLSCPERSGMLEKAGEIIAATGAHAREARHFDDPDTSRFFLRMVIEHRAPQADWRTQTERQIAAIAQDWGMDWCLWSQADKPRIVILASKTEHCLADLLYHWRVGLLPVEIAAVISNHDAHRSVVEWHGIPYHHLPVEEGAEAEQEQAVRERVDAADPHYIILARYMRILSADFCNAYRGRLVNIHHSLLPALKGAAPHRRAYEAGVKMIGATAHFVIPELDEGPIIEQDVARVDHSYQPDELKHVGLYVERRVLTRSVVWLAEGRVFRNGGKTVVL